MAIPTIVATPGAVNANSFGTRAEADAYHETQLHPDAPWPSNVSATATIGSGTNGTVTITVVLPGTEGNDYTVEVEAGVGVGVPLSIAFVSPALTITLGTNGAGALDSTKNTATLVATLISTITEFTASASGSGVTVVPVTSSKSFTGGSYNEETKNPALIMAAQQMMSLIDWTGYYATSTQSLSWPRSSMWRRNNLVSVPTTEVPNEVKWAQFELARLLLYEDRTVESDISAEGITSIKAGPIALQFKDMESTTVVIPSTVSDLLVPSWVNSVTGQATGTRDLFRV